MSIVLEILDEATAKITKGISDCLEEAAQCRDQLTMLERTCNEYHLELKKIEAARAIFLADDLPEPPVVKVPEQLCKPILHAVETSPEPEKAITQKPKPDTLSAAKSKPKGITPHESRMEDIQNLLIDMGACYDWVKITYAELGEKIGCTHANKIKEAIDGLVESHDLRVCRLMAGPDKGNFYTFHKHVTEMQESEPEPGPEPKQEPKTAVEPPFVDEVVGYAMAALKGKKAGVFQAGISFVAKKCGCTEGQAIAAMQFLNDESGNGMDIRQAEYDKTQWVFNIREGV